jgi:hypothetical protein
MTPKSTIEPVFGRDDLPGGHVAAVSNSAIRNPRFGLLGATATLVTTLTAREVGRILARWPREAAP